MCRRKTICTSDVVWALHRQGRPVYVSTTQSLDVFIYTDPCVGVRDCTGPWSQGLSVADPSVLRWTLRAHRNSQRTNDHF